MYTAANAAQARNSFPCSNFGPSYERPHILRFCFVAKGHTTRSPHTHRHCSKPANMTRAAQTISFALLVSSVCPQT